MQRVSFLFFLVVHHFLLFIELPDMSYYQQYQHNSNPYNSQPPQQVYTPTQGFQQPQFTMPSGNMASPQTYNESEPLSQGILAAFSTSGYPGEATLFEELGVNFGHIKAKTWSVLSLKSKSLNEDILQDSDMAGPILFCFSFGAFLLLSGKTHFGYIYGVALFGTLSLHFLFKLMSSNGQGLDFLTTASTLGYCLLPLVVLSGLAVILPLDNMFGYIFSLVSIAWCTWASSGLFVRVLSLSQARLLVAYPLTMFYSIFALMAIFVEKKS